eukprot:SAG11_NODE_6560_length_1288_cov_2.417998_2_plen_170_part_00
MKLAMERWYGLVSSPERSRSEFQKEDGLTEYLERCSDFYMLGSTTVVPDDSPFNVGFSCTCAYHLIFGCCGDHRDVRVLAQSLHTRRTSDMERWYGLDSDPERSRSEFQNSSVSAASSNVSSPEVVVAPEQTRVTVSQLISPSTVIAASVLKASLILPSIGVNAGQPTR